MFTHREILVKEFSETKFVPAIHEMLSKSDPLTYIRYRGRCCKQISFLLTIFLNQALPNYEWTAWESTFIDEREEYTHAWVFGQSKVKESQHIILDYGKLVEEYSFFLKTDYNEYPSHLKVEGESPFPLLLDQENEENRKPLLPKGKETFTRRTFNEIYKELELTLKIPQFLLSLSE